MNRQTVGPRALGRGHVFVEVRRAEKHKSTRESGPNVVLIALDTTRAMPWVWRKNETPVLDALAKQGTMFTHAVSTAPIHSPHIPILSGNPPHLTGVVTNGADMETRAAMLSYALGGGVVTGAFVSAYPLTQQFGWAQGGIIMTTPFVRPDGFGRERPAPPSILPSNG